MNAETGNEPESPKKRGRIPQTAWPRILERYRAGATLSAIAREFECTPSAISYIVRKAEAAGMLGEDGSPIPVSPDPEPDSESAPAAEAPADAAPAPVPEPAPAPVPAPAAPAPAPAAAAPAQRRREAPPPAQAPAPQPQGAPQAAEPRRTLRIEPPAPPQPAPVAPAPASAPAAAQQPAPAPAVQPADPAAAGNRPAGRPEPTPPVDAVEARLRETARGCLSAYRNWRQTPGETSIQALSDAVHDLRKALARIEIDMSASRREEQAIRPIPIPAHRAARRQ